MTTAEDVKKPASGLLPRAIVATCFAVLVFAALSVYGDVTALRASLQRFDVWAFIAALALATCNYVLRFGRWHYYLLHLGIRVPLFESLVVFIAGFVMSITPGKVGEVLKSVLLYSSRGTPVARTAPIVVAERITDLAALVILAGIGALALHRGLVVTLSAGAVVAFGLVACSWRPLGEAMLRLCERLPVVKRVTPKLREAYEALRSLMHPKALAMATMLSTGSWFLECVALYLIVRGFPGAHLDLFSSVFAYSVPTILGALAMLPGGLGLTEVGMTGALEALGGTSITRAVATATTILVRLATLWWAVLLGAGALFVFRRIFAGERAKSTVSGPTDDLAGRGGVP